MWWVTNWKTLEQCWYFSVYPYKTDISWGEQENRRERRRWENSEGSDRSCVSSSSHWDCEPLFTLYLQRVDTVLSGLVYLHFVRVECRPWLWVDWYVVPYKLEPNCTSILCDWISTGPSFSTTLHPNCNSVGFVPDHLAPVIGLWTVGQHLWAISRGIRFT